jgi:hypothetical protein
MATKLFTLRLKPATLDKLEARARETGQPKSRLAQRLIEEGLRMEAHPGILFRDGPTGRRAALARGPDVWEIIPVVKNEGGGEEGVAGAAKYFEFPVEWIRDAVRYYAEYREEIDDRIRANEELAERAEAEWRRQQEVLAG